MSDEIKSSTTTSLPFGIGEVFEVREDSSGNRGVGRTAEEAQNNLEQEQAKNKD